jgi:hypothetical protein
MKGRRALWGRGAVLVVVLAALCVLHARRSRSMSPAAAVSSDVASSYPRGAALRYLPEHCASYRFYVDVKSLTDTLELRDVLTSERLPAPWKSTFETFEMAHLRVGQEILDIAACAQESPGDDDAPSKTYVAIGGRFGGREALHKYRSIVRALTHAKDTEVLEKESNGIPYLVSSYSPTRKWIAMPAPDVLVFYTDAVSQVATLAKAHEGDLRAWRLADATVATFDVRRDCEGEPASDSRGAFSGVLSVRGPRGSQSLIFEARGTAASSEAATVPRLALLKARLAGAIERSAFPQLADSVWQMMLEAPGESVHVRMEVPVAKLIEAGMTASTHREAVPELWGELQRLVNSPAQL